MTLQQLSYVTEVSECGSFNKAAQKLFMSQSNLSDSIKNLEKEIGRKIFRRTNRGVLVTPEGEEFLIYAKQIVDQYRLTEEKFVLGKESKKSFSISSQHYTFAIEAFINMAKKYSINKYAFGIYECKTEEIIRNVKNFKSELGILYLDDFNREFLLKMFEDNNLIFEELFDCRTYVFLARSNPLAKKEIITIEDLEPYPCLSFDQGSDNAFFLSEEVYSTYDYHQIIKASDRGTLLNLMRGLNGYTLCSGIIGEDLNGPEYTVVPFKSDIIMHIGYIQRKDSNLSKMAVEYIDELSKFGSGQLN